MGSQQPDSIHKYIYLFICRLLDLLIIDWLALVVFVCPPRTRQISHAHTGGGWFASMACCWTGWQQTGQERAASSVSVKLCTLNQCVRLSTYNPCVVCTDKEKQPVASRATCWCQWELATLAHSHSLCRASASTSAAESCNTAQESSSV